MPKWLTFLITMAAANGLVSLGIVGLMRGGVVPFGQGMVLAIGGYAAALAFNKLGFTDALGLALAGGVPGEHACLPLQGAGHFIVEAAIRSLVPEGGAIIVLAVIFMPRGLLVWRMGRAGAALRRLK